MIKTIYFLVIVSFIFIPSPGWASNSKNIYHRKIFYNLLKEHKLQEALPYLIYFKSPQGVERELLAQFYLYTLSPQKAYSHIKKITNDEQKKLFEIILAGLISIDRRLIIKGKITKKHFGPSEKFVHFPIDSDEIWIDEWANFSIGQVNHDKFPLIKDIKKRKLYRNFAKEGLQDFKTAQYVKDFSIVAMSLDLNVKLKEPQKIADNYQRFKKNPYYKLLLQQILPKKEHFKVKVLGFKRNEIKLTSLKLEKNRKTVHKIEIPFLLNKDDF